MKIISLLTRQEINRGILLFLMILIMALLDTIGVASVFPFMAVLSNPDIVNNNFFLNTFFNFSKNFGVENEIQFIFFLGIFLFLMLVSSLIFKSLTIYAQLRFIQMREYTIGKRILNGYLNQPYSWFLSRHSADIGKTILSEITVVIQQGLSPFILLIANSTVAISLVLLLIIINPLLAFMVGIILGASYGIIYLISRSYLNKIGQKRLKNNQIRFTAVTEAFGASKEVKVRGLEQNFINRFSNAAQIFARTNSSALAIQQLPRFALEGVAFGSVILVMLYLISQNGNFSDVLPIVSLYVFAGYRLMPALQQIYSSITQLRFIGPSVNSLSDDLKNIQQIKTHSNNEKININKSISLKNIYYNYPNTSRVALNDINLNIPAHSKVGFVGSTGSGKTTTVDIILGLLEPQKGSLEVDGIAINKENVKSWQRSIGYVPQHIFLSDDTVAANIAFGIDPEEIDNDALEKASKIANLHDFVTKELPNQYQTTIGERGVRLSGGERQRIGIARALYNNPKVLILDEATSSLDNKTEKAVMEAVNNLSKDILIILIAHRLNTVKNCDKIFQLEKGRIINQGTFQELEL